MNSVVRIGLFFSMVVCLLAEGTSKLESYRTLLSQAKPYPVPAPAEPENPGRAPRSTDLGGSQYRSAWNRFVARSDAWEAWRVHQAKWEVASAEYQTGELNRLVALNGSYGQMLEDLGLRQTLSLLRQARYFAGPLPELPSHIFDDRVVFQQAVKAFGHQTRTVGSAVEGIMAGVEELDSSLAVLPFIEGLLTQQFFEAGHELPHLSSAFHSAANTLPGKGLKFGEQLLLSTATPTAFLFLLSIERSLAGRKWPSIVHKEFNEALVFRRFLELSPTEAQWAELLSLWPAARALTTLKETRIWVGLTSRIGLHVRACADYLSESH